MITHITIKNVAVIISITLEFETGFNVLTGETAAGKSIIIDAINMALGSRVSRDLIRNGEDKAMVEALFSVNDPSIISQLAELGIECDDSVIIRREITADGRNICRINGSMVTTAVLREITENLINIHGQHDNQALLTPAKHIEFLDKFAGVEKEKFEFQAVFAKQKEYEKRLQMITADEKEKAQKLDMLQFQLNEINSANLQPNEDETLQHERDVLANSAKIFEAISSAYTSLYSNEHSAVDILAKVAKDVASAAEFDSSIKPIASAIEEIKINADDISHQLRSYIDKIDQNPNKLDEIEERLHTIYNLKRKYGATIDDILTYKAELEEELNNIVNSDEIIDELRKKIEENAKLQAELAEKLTQKRQTAAKILQEKIVQELVDLEMAKVKFSVEIKPQGFTANGADSVEFLISTNAGEALKPLAKIASGGELSRIMLAIKSILADTDNINTLIFDEIDTGISGRAAQKTAEKLAKIGRTKQILCITHLAQIASMADNHFLIKKNVTNNKTTTKVTKLDIKGRESELARIIGGAQITELTLKNAKEMLELAEKVKD